MDPIVYINVNNGIPLDTLM